MLTFLFIKSVDVDLPFPDEIRKYGLGMSFNFEKNAYGIVNFDDGICVDYVSADEYILVCARKMYRDDV